MEETEASKSKSVEMHLFINSLKKKKPAGEKPQPANCVSLWLARASCSCFFGKRQKNIQEFLSCPGKNSALHISRNKRKREHPCNLIVTFAIFFLMYACS